jgi:hypothetical protein
MARLNWDRVNKENRITRYGAEQVRVEQPEKIVKKIQRKRDRANAPKARKKDRVNALCWCGFRSGHTGDHSRCWCGLDTGHKGPHKGYGPPLTGPPPLDFLLAKARALKNVSWRSSRCPVCGWVGRDIEGHVRNRHRERHRGSPAKE